MWRGVREGEGGGEVRLRLSYEGRRGEMSLVSKVYPHSAGGKSAMAACERRLRRLATDRLDLYLLHWRGRVPLAETVDAFERLRRDGKILRWGVSNFDVADVEELLALPEGLHCAVNQVLYHLGERGIEWALAPRCRDAGIALMASPPLRPGPAWVRAGAAPTGVCARNKTALATKHFTGALCPRL